MTVDLPHLSRAKSRGLTDPASSAILDLVKEENRDKDKNWYAISSRKRILAIDKNFQGNRPQTYLDLAKPEYKGKILTRSGTSSYNISWVASLIELYGEERTREFLKGFVANFARPPQGNDRKQVSDIYAKNGEIALVNSYYLGRMFHSQDEEERNAANSVDLIFPDPVHRNISGGALLKNAKNPAEGIALLEYLISPEVQSLIVNANYEFSVNSEVPVNPVFTNWGGVPESTDLAGFNWGDKQDVAIRLIDEAAWK